MGQRLSIMLLFFSFGVMFSLIYASSYVMPPPLQYYHDPSTVPTEPKITQIQALEVAAQAIKKQWYDMDDENIRLWFTQYNYSGDYETNPEKYTGYQWPLTTVRQHPELLHLQLAYFHPNGTIYHIDGSDVRVCGDCGMAAEARKNHLVWRIDAVPEIMDIDAETGKVMWPRLDASKLPLRVPIYEDISEAKTVREESQSWRNPPETTKIEILDGSGANDTGISFKPERAVGTIELSNWVVWTNGDSVPHTVRYDDRYPVRLSEQFHSGSIPPGGTFEHMFDRVGEYPYHCDIHPWMKGTVRITENFA